MAQRVPTELGEKPIGILLMNYALPAIMAMVASSLYNIVDRAFIGHYVGTLALGGLTFCPELNDNCVVYNCSATS